MRAHWAEIFLGRIRSLDQSESPHGLYGIRRAYNPNGPLPTLAHVLASDKKAGFFSNHYDTSGRQNPLWNTVTFVAENDGAIQTSIVVSLTIDDFATTKVRKFGASHRIDPRNRKESLERPNIGRLVRKAVQLKDRFPVKCMNALFFLLHTATEAEAAQIFGRYGEALFLARYGIERHSLRWNDELGRDFVTTATIWSPNAEAKVANEC
jgi:hypothetical protein